MALNASRFGFGGKGKALNPGGRNFDFNEVPPIRQANDSGHGEPDEQDNDRIGWATYLWDSQDDSHRKRDRQIEENIRMLSGQQWSVFNPRIGRFVDVTQWMTEEEKKWRQRPVFNRLLPWFIITHARMTENPPIVTFLPGPDRIDAELAETMDILFKTKWRDIRMAEIWDRASAWLIPGGTVYLESTIDMSKGKFIQFEGRPDDEDIEGLNPEQAEAIRGLREDQNVGFDQQGQVQFDEEGNPLGPEAGHTERKGDLAVRVLNAVQVRGEWGPNEWHEKSYHIVRSFLTVAEVFETYGVKLDGAQAANSDDDNNILERLTYGSGYFGAADPMTMGADFGSQISIPEPTVETFAVWHKPVGYAGMEESPDEPGGRLLVVTRQDVLHDSTRPVAYPYTSPIRRFDFVKVPGRPAGGTTPQEAMNQPQRIYNKIAANIIEHTNLSTNPIKVIDAQSGIEERQLTNRPGLNIKVNRRDRIPPFEWVAPPTLSSDAYKSLELMRREIDELGNLEGTEGGAPTEDASGELVKELRFNSDRFLGPTMRRAAEEFGRMAEDWKALFPVLYDEEEIISFTGQDNVARTVVVLPEMFDEGSVNIISDVESMLPEGRGERQKNITALYANGLFGPPGTPQSISSFFELSRFPHLGRAGKFGGVHRITADQENGKLLQGTPAAEIPVFDWYNDLVHLLSHEEFMSSPEFLKIDPQIQQQFVMHRQMHIMNITMKAVSAAEADPEGGQAGQNQFTGNDDPAGRGVVGASDTQESREANQSGSATRTPQGVDEAPGAAGQGPA